MRTALRPHAGKCLLIACCERLQNVPPTAAIRYMKTVSPQAILPGALVAMFLISLSSFRDPRAAARRGTAYAPMCGNGFPSRGIKRPKMPRRTVRLCDEDEGMLDDVRPEGGKANWIDAQAYLVQYGFHQDEPDRIDDACQPCAPV
jgi:hypothetical protein